LTLLTEKLEDFDRSFVAVAFGVVENVGAADAKLCYLNLALRCSFVDVDVDVPFFIFNNLFYLKNLIYLI